MKAALTLGLNALLAIVAVFMIALIFLFVIKDVSDTHQAELINRAEKLDAAMRVFPLLHAEINGKPVYESLADGDCRALDGYKCKLYADGKKVDCCANNPVKPAKTDFSVYHNGELHSYTLEVDT